MSIPNLKFVIDLMRMGETSNKSVYLHNLYRFWRKPGFKLTDQRYYKANHVNILLKKVIIFALFSQAHAV